MASNADVKTETVSYASSVDGTQPLYADIAFVPTRQKKPLVVVMHGYNGSKADVAHDIRELSQKGVVAIAPDMRGAGASAGKFDSGGIEVHDILDAVLFVVRRYPAEIDARNLNVVGYSGGGGNAISCAVRFPDVFRTCVSFFGISDYAAWNKSKGRPDCNVRMEAAIGTIATQPDAYAARNANAAAGNVCVTKMHFFWDENETQCPPNMIRQFIEANKAAGRQNCIAHVSTAKDTHRWLHGYRSGIPSLSDADAMFLRDMLAPVNASPRLPPRGTLVINGYLVTRHFSVWMGDGQKGSIKVAYDISDASPVVTVIENPKNYDVRITASPLTDLP